jgi:3-oxoacyl-[acyl-carrier-protein] synthase II
MMAPPRIVVTGVGAVTAVGLNTADFWSALTAGRSGVTSITRFDASTYPSKLAAEINGFDPLKYMDVKLAERTGPYTQWAIASTVMAMEMAGLDMQKERSERVGTVIATTGDVHKIGDETDVLKARGPRRIDPLFMNRISAHMAPVQVGKFIGARGPNTSINSACASGSDAIGMAFNHMRLGRADVMVAGGTDTLVSPICVATMGLLGALSRDAEPGKAPRPFDKDRNGMVVGEGAGMLVLETLEHARARGARILCEMAGAGWSYDARNDTAPDPEGEALAMKAALDDAGMKPEEIDYINAHGTGTRLNDASETRALKLVLGGHAYRIPVSSNKSMIGHLGAGAGGVEAVASVLTMVNGVIPPTINYVTPDPECDLDYVPNVARKAEVTGIMSNSFGMGGQNCAIIFRRFTGA